MNEGVLTIDPDGHVLFANDRLSELTGFPTDDLIDRHVATLFAGEAPELISDASLEATLLRRDETQLPVKVWTRSISLGEKGGYVSHPDRSFGLSPGRTTCRGRTVHTIHS